MTPVSKSLALAAWFFKRNSGVFVSCPSAVPSPSPQLNYFFPFLKEALRWKERHLGFMMFHVVGLLFFFKELLFAWLGAFTQCCFFFLDSGGRPHPLFFWLWKSVSRECKVMVVYRTEDISSELVLFLRHWGKLLS